MELFGFEKHEWSNTGANFQPNSIFRQLNMLVLTGCMTSQVLQQKNRNVWGIKIKARNHNQHFLLLYPRQKSNICCQKLIKI